MNTKTMRLPPRRVPVTGKPTVIAVMKPPPPIIPPVQSVSRKSPAPAATVTATTEPAGSNQLLAGYLAHEFLTNGTLFGEQWNPFRPQTGSVSVQPVEPMKSKPINDTEPTERKRRRYVEVANLIRADGTHVPGVVNPAQLARFIK